MAESMLIFAPNANSYRRFRRNSYAPVAANWGINNRTVSLRIPAGAAPTCHIEHRPAGADANPYLVLAAVLAGIHHGITQKLDPGQPVTGNGYERRARYIPGNWYDAIDAFWRASMLKEYFGKDFVEIFCHHQGGRGRSVLRRADGAGFRVVSANGLEERDQSWPRSSASPIPASASSRTTISRR